MVNLPNLASPSECLGCMLCADVCPKKAITIKEDNNGYWLPYVDSSICVGCHACERKCQKVRKPVLVNKCEQPLKGWCIEDDIRRQSASGGIFSAIAINMLHKHHAVVYGATLQDNKVYHIGIENEADLHMLQGSKYIQSNTAGIYCNVKEHLNKGRFVVFSGTPCQINALKTYLGKDYDNLLTIDLICHGVISNTIFKRHIEKNNIGEVLTFRDKSLGWGKDVFFKTKKEGVITVDTNWIHNFFYHTFQLETCTRNSCYDCPFCTPLRVSDITIGDYWAAKRTDEYNPLGISTILPNTPKGLKAMTECDNIESSPVDWLSTIKPNPRLFTARPLFRKFACGKYIGFFYRFLPNVIVDNILGVWYSKRNILFLPWLKYIQHVKQQYETQYQQKLKKSMKN